MGDKSSIEWTDATWNPVTGCTKVSPGCAHCYAETFAERWRGIPGHPYEQGFDLTPRPDRLDIPLRWKKPRMVFVNSMSDLFHEDIPFEFIAAVFGVMAAAPQHTFQILTKRPERAQEFMLWRTYQVELRDLRYEPWRVCEGEAVELVPDLPAAGTSSPWPLPNVWLGVSIENHRFAGRAELLRRTPAAVRFISAEPLLGPLICPECKGSGSVAPLGGLPGGRACPMGCANGDGPRDFPPPTYLLGDIDQLIVGGESGPKHRRIDPMWVRDLRDWCIGTDYRPQRTAFFFKQWGGHRPKANGRELHA